jgi:hypothetical protein
VGITPSKPFSGGEGKKDLTMRVKHMGSSSSMEIGKKQEGLRLYRANAGQKLER